MNKIKFAQRSSVEFVEEGNNLAPKFNSEDVIPVVVTETKSGLVLMLGYMNKEALEKTILTKEAHYWSRSRKALWKKGESSGMVHKIDEILSLEFEPKEYEEKGTYHSSSDLPKAVDWSSIIDDQIQILSIY